MRFGPLPLAEAEDALLAHALTVGAVRLKKGRRLSAADVAALAEAGLETVVAARLDPADLDEDSAAGLIAAALAGEAAARGLSLSVPFTGRANLFAVTDGVLRVDAEAIHAANAVDETVTVATLPDFARVGPRQMVATVKIIPYAAPRAAVERAAAVLAAAVPLAVHPFRLRSATLILTETPGSKPSVAAKGAAAVRARLAGLGIAAVAEMRVPHCTEPLTEALRAATGEIVLILTASATSDRRDVGPAAVEAAGGFIARFGMPVDPGNLLFTGTLGSRPVLGLPGCARSPKLNGADWVLERLAAGLPAGSDEIAAMGVGGLLKEIPSRPEPRAGGARGPQRPLVAAVLLAAGSATRMGGADKLLEPVGGVPMLRHAAAVLQASRADRVLVVLDPARPAREAALAGLGVETAPNRSAAEGMAASVRAAMAALGPEVDAVVLALADMPEVTPAHIDRLIAAFDPEEGRAICRAVTASGVPGHPVLFGRRFFETLGRIEGDQGPRAVIAEHPDLVELVPTPGEGAAVDLDTPEAWAAWRARRG